MTDQAKSVPVLVAGLDTMGGSHALAYHTNPDFEVVGLVKRSDRALSSALADYRLFTDFEQTLAVAKPDLVAIARYPDTQASHTLRDRAVLDKDGTFVEADRVIAMESEPDHQALCDRE